MNEYFSFSENQEKFALAWINGSKVEEKNLLLSLKVLIVFIVILTMIKKKKNSCQVIVENQETLKQILQKSFLKKILLVGCLTVKV